MAQVNEQDTELSEDADPLALLRLKLQKTQKMVLVLAGVTAVALLTSLALLGVTLISGSRISGLEKEVVESGARHSEEIRTNATQLALALEALAQTRHGLTALDTLVAGIDIDDPRNVVVRIQRIMIRQERDFRQFLIELEQALLSIQMMIPHSRGWWDAYAEQIHESISLSEARENYVLNLREN